MARCEPDDSSERKSMADRYLNSSFYLSTAASVVFLGLAVAFIFDLWGNAKPEPEYNAIDPVWTNTTTVRLSVKQLEAMGGDTSGMDCYACHNQEEEFSLPADDDNHIRLPEGHRDLIYYRRNCAACHRESNPVEVEWDDDGAVIIPPEHQDLVLRHGRNKRNNNCFNCHNPQKLDELVTREGRELGLGESTQLCASCHGPTYVDWEVGIHGRSSGFWNKEMGSSERLECTSCHDPHAPAFPAMIPAPAPDRLQQRISQSKHASHE